MGTWSHEPFGNDTAGDWTDGLRKAKDLSYLERTLDKVLKTGSGYLEAPDAEEAIAAAEVLAKLLGRGTQSDSYTERVDAWVRTVRVTPSTELRDKARRALLRVVSEKSELLELWDESDDGDQWKKSVESLRSSLEV